MKDPIYVIKFYSQSVVLHDISLHDILCRSHSTETHEMNKCNAVLGTL